jgi:hypothetical protein
MKGQLLENDHAIYTRLPPSSAAESFSSNEDIEDVEYAQEEDLDEFEY